MDSKIEQFLLSQHLLALATMDGSPYAVNCFYVYDKEQKALIFASALDTTHMQQIMKNPQVAGTIALCEKRVAKIQGVQFRGEVKEADKRQRRLYLQTFPIARAIDHTLWQIHLSWIKMTDNTLGFKTKILWRRD
jgi:uncharacterized protein YhbP (UPF0306 family)